MELILASASPRRKELLEKIGLPFTVQPAMGEERITQKSPAAVVMELSRQKAEEIAAAQTEDCIIIGYGGCQRRENHGQAEGRGGCKADAQKYCR